MRGLRDGYVQYIWHRQLVCSRSRGSGVLCPKLPFDNNSTVDPGRRLHTVQDRLIRGVDRWQVRAPGASPA